MIATVRALWVLARPKGTLLVGLAPMFGYAFAFWDHGIEEGGARPFLVLLLLALAWMVPNAGTLWLNAALDRDRGPVVFGESTSVPARIACFALPTFAFALGIASQLSTATLTCVASCTLLAFAYSHPRLRWKGHAVMGPLTNALGYGLLSPLGGYFAAELVPTPRACVVLAGTIVWSLAAYFAAQAFQEEEDRARGDATFVARWGGHATLRLTLALTLLGTLVLAGLVLSRAIPPLTALSLPVFGSVAAGTVVALRAPRPTTEDDARRFFGRLALAGLAAVACVSADYAWVRAELGKPAGIIGR